MAGTTVGRTKNRAGRVPRLAAAAATATAMAAGLTAPGIAAADDVTLNATTTGPLFRLADAFGFNSFAFPDLAPPLIDTLRINLNYAPNDPVSLADTINSYPFGGFSVLGTLFKRQPGGLLGTAILAGSGLGAFNVGTAYEAMLSSAGGATLPGYTPFVPAGTVYPLTGEPCTGFGCVQATNVTNLAVLQVNNPGTPNGGLFSRFQPVLDLFGANGVSAGSASASSTGIQLNASTVGLALGYNLLSDFPETLNPFSLVNSLLATVLPTNLLGGGDIKGDSVDTLELRLAALAGLGTTSTSFSTVAPNDLPLLEPLRLPVRIINLVLSALGVPLTLPTPIADALQPAAKILVNIGYTDVITPDELDTCATGCADPDPTKHKTYAELGYAAYDRSYLESGTYTPFLSKNPLTPQQWAKVPGDVIVALADGIKDVLQTPPAAAPSVVPLAANSVAQVSNRERTAAHRPTLKLNSRKNSDSRPAVSAASQPQAVAVPSAVDRIAKPASAGATVGSTRSGR